MSITKEKVEVEVEVETKVFHKKTGEGETIEESVSMMEIGWNIRKMFTTENDTLYYQDRDEPCKWFRNNFRVGTTVDDFVKKNGPEILFINTNINQVISLEEFQNLENNDGWYEFWEYHFQVVDGKMGDWYCENYRNGLPKFKGRYEDGKKNGICEFYDKNGVGVAGEYKDNKLVRILNGLVSVKELF
jgi:hypothetical protein